MEYRRRVYKKFGDIFLEIDFMELRKGDIFKLIDEGPTVYEDGSRLLCAREDAYRNSVGIGMVFGDFIDESGNIIPDDEDYPDIEMP